MFSYSIIVYSGPLQLQLFDHVPIWKLTFIILHCFNNGAYTLEAVFPSLVVLNDVYICPILRLLCVTVHAKRFSTVG